MPKEEKYSEGQDYHESHGNIVMPIKVGDIHVIKNMEKSQLVKGESRILAYF